MKVGVAGVKSADQQTCNMEDHSVFFWNEMVFVRIMRILRVWRSISSERERSGAMPAPSSSFLFCLSYYHSFSPTYLSISPITSPCHARQASATASSQFIRSLRLLCFCLLPFLSSFLVGAFVVSAICIWISWYTLFACGIQIFLLAVVRGLFLT